MHHKPDLWEAFFCPFLHPYHDYTQNDLNWPILIWNQRVGGDIKIWLNFIHPCIFLQCILQILGQFKANSIVGIRRIRLQKWKINFFQNAHQGRFQYHLKLIWEDPVSTIPHKLVRYIDLKPGGSCAVASCRIGEGRWNLLFSCLELWGTSMPTFMDFG